MASADESYRDKAHREYYESYPNKVLALFDLDQIKRSMYQELRQNYATNLSWARSLEIGREVCQKPCLIIAIHARV